MSKSLFIIFLITITGCTNNIFETKEARLNEKIRLEVGESFYIDEEKLYVELIDVINNYTENEQGTEIVLKIRKKNMTSEIDTLNKISGSGSLFYNGYSINLDNLEFLIPEPEQDNPDKFIATIVVYNENY